MPAPVRNRDRLIGIGEPVLPRYERIAFEKALDQRRRASRSPPSSAPATRCSTPTIDLTLERHRDLLKRGAVLVDERDPGTQPARALLPRARHPGRQPHPLRRAPRSSRKRMLYVELDARAPRATCTTRPTSTTARSRTDEPDVDAMLARPECAWISRDLEQKAPRLRRRARSCPSTSPRSATAGWR